MVGLLRRCRRLLGASLPAFVLVSVAVPDSSLASGSPPADGAFEAWTATTGWQPLPEPPTSPPALSWELELTADAAVAVHADAVVVVAPTTAASAEVQRIDTSTGEYVWQAKVDGGQEADVVIDPTGSLVTVSTRSPAEGLVVTVLGAAKGQVIWTASQVDVTPFVQFVDGLAILTTTTEAVAIDVADRAERWRLDGSVTAYPSALVVHTEAPTVGGDPTFGIVDPDTGVAVWERERPQGSIATALGDVVILSHDEVGSDDSLAGFDRTTGDPLWTTAVPLIGNSGAWPLGDDAALYGGNSEYDAPGSLVAVDLRTGALRWTSTYHKPGGLSMWRSGDGQFLFTRTEDLTTEVIDAGTGRIARSTRSVPGGAWPAFSAGVLYFYEALGGELDGSAVTAVEMSSLQPTWTVDTEFAERVAGAVAGGFVAHAESPIGQRLSAFHG